MTEVKSAIEAIRADVDEVKVTVKEKTQNQHQTGSKRKIDLGMLRLLETLTLVSSRQNKQMEKIKDLMTEKPQTIHHFLNQVEQKTNETRDQVKALSIKVDNYVDLSERKKEDMNADINIPQEKGYPFQDVTLVLSNISQKVSCANVQKGPC